MKGDRRRQALFAVLLGLLALAATVAPSHAASRICRQLQAELDGGAAPAGGPKQLRKYDSAIARQQDEIAKARAQTRKLGCGFSLFSKDVSHCASLNAALTRMNRNLDDLQAKRAKLAKGGKRRTRAQLLALMDANSCRGETKKPVIVHSSDGTVQRLLGERIERADRPNEILDGDALWQMLEQPEGAPLPGAGRYRTMCVRTCDGYFFPMSNAASVSDFERDQKNCESSCPGADVQLFYSQGLSEDSARMISVATGRPYSELRTAYLYKNPQASVPQSCGCNAPRGFSIVGGVGGLATPSSQQMQSVSPSVSVVPTARPDPAADPETQANAEGGLDAETIRRLAQERSAAQDRKPENDRKVRVVGPTFLPDQSGATGPQAPDPRQDP